MWGKSRSAGRATHQSSSRPLHIPRLHDYRDVVNGVKKSLDELLFQLRVFHVIRDVSEGDLLITLVANTDNHENDSARRHFDLSDKLGNILDDLERSFHHSDTSNRLRAPHTHPTNPRG